MTKIDMCDTQRNNLIAAALGLQQCTKTASAVIPLPGTKQYILVGDKAELTKLLAAEQPLNLPDPAPLALRTLGGLMANVLYNLVQRPSEPLTGADVAKMDHLRLQWDEAVRVDRQAALQQLVAAGQEQDAQTQAARDVLAERRRQVKQEGWTPTHDDQYRPGTMARAAACYASINSKPVPSMWPWAAEWWKPRDDRDNYVRAGALILAEIERMDRAAQQATTEHDHSEGGHV